MAKHMNIKVQLKIRRKVFLDQNHLNCRRKISQLAICITTSYPYFKISQLVSQLAILIALYFSSFVHINLNGQYTKCNSFYINEIPALSISRILYGIRANYEIEKETKFCIFFPTMSTTSSSSPALTQSDDYPYPVTQNIANFVSLHLSSTNFLLWKTQMLNILESYNLQGFINGEVQPPPQFINNADCGTQTNPAFVKWRKTDRLVKGWLTTTLSEEVLGIAVGLNTTFEV